MATPPREQPEAPIEPLAEAVKMHLIGAVQFGRVIISYEHGKPVHVERYESIRLTRPPDK